MELGRVGWAVITFQADSLGDLKQGWSIKVVLHYDQGFEFLCLYAD